MQNLASPRGHFRSSFALLVLVGWSFAPAGLWAEDPPREDSRAALILQQIDSRAGDSWWPLTERLLTLDREATVPILRSQLTKASERGRFACAQALLELGDDDAKHEAIGTLTDLAREASDKSIRAAAIALVGAEGDPDEALKVLQELLVTARDPAILIPLCRALWDLDRVVPARDKLVDLVKSQDPAVRQQAALALAEIGYYEGDVREILRQLKRLPTSEGRRAEALDLLSKLQRQLDRVREQGEAPVEGADLNRLVKIKDQRIRELEDRLERASKSTELKVERDPSELLLEEIILHIQKSYVDEAKTDRAKLLLRAVEGMVRSLDEFSSFMGVDDTKSFRQTIAGEYDGIGATVNKPPEGPLEIVKPLYGGPAYKAGILSGDKVLEVDGVRTDEPGIDDIVRKLKGVAGSTVTLKVFRRGWIEPKTFTIERRLVELPSVHYELLPGKLGYLQLLQFGEKSADEVLGALDQLEKDGMSGLILDLRNNPGGLLEAAVRIVDQFVKGDMPIVTQKGRSKSKREDGEIPTYPDEFTRPNYPIMVLVNGRSASASEIVSGALQDFARATIIGQRTFGKGSVQRLIPLSSTARQTLGGEGQLRLTVQYYFLPLGRCIHTIRDENGAVVEEGGVKPDIEVIEDRLQASHIEERERLRSHPQVLEYVDKSWESIKSLFADGDAHDPTRYPGFEELCKSTDTTIGRDDLRAVVRFHVRRRWEDERGREFACDLQEDLQLQRAIWELLGKLGEKPESFPRYATLLPRPQDAEKKN